MSAFWEKVLRMFEESVITQSLLVLTVFGTLAYCILTGTEIPDVLNQYGMVIIGFFFGAKSNIAVLKGLSK